MSRIHPAASVDKGAQLGEDVEIGPYCIVGAQVKLGARTRLQSHVNIEGLTEIGEDCVVHPFASLGGVPQHAAHTGEPTRLIIGDRNQIREHVTMNAGSSVGSGVTKVGSDGMFYTGAHVAHDCVVGDRVLLTNLATLGGHVVVGDYAIVGEVLSVEPIAIMFRKDDPAFKKAVDDSVKAMIKSGEVAKLYDKWFMQPIPPSNTKVGLPASDATKAAWANPNDKPTEDYAEK